MRHRLLPVVVATVCALAAGCASSGAEPNTAPASRTASGSQRPGTSSGPVGLIALGHSALTGENSDPDQPGVEVRENSWATGTAAGLDSIYQRMVALNPATEGHVDNAASAGAPADLLAGQAQRALEAVPTPELAIIQTIDADIRCDGTDPSHVSDFGASVQAALQVITDASPQTKILVITQPGRPAGELAGMAKAIRSDPAAKAAYTGPAPCGMYDETTGKLMPSRVKALTGIIAGYEAEQARVCAQFPTCSTDEGALASFRRTPDLVSADYNHLNAAGLAALAAAVWPYAQQALASS